jgi:hypothetical protein
MGNLKNLVHSLTNNADISFNGTAKHQVLAILIKATRDLFKE